MDLRELGTEMAALSPESMGLLREAIQQQTELHEAEAMTMQWEAQGPEDALAFNPPPIFCLLADGEIWGRIRLSGASGEESPGGATT